MKLSRRFHYLTTALFLTSSLSAVDVRNQDIESLRDWINTKRMITVKELGGQLSISGDIHAEMQSSNEVKDGIQQRGGKRTPFQAFDAELNLNIDYRTENTWAAGRIKFDNDAGIVSDDFGSGKNNKIKVDRAFFGYRVLDQDRHTMEVELGRRPAINNIFESKIEFGSTFDGINFKDSYALEKVGDVYYQLGMFLVNEKKSEAAYVGEVGALNIAKTGVYTKYSLIDWDTKKLPNIPEQMQFIVSQLVLGYKFIPTKLDKIVMLYSGALCNHRARPHEISANKRANWGGYVGFSMGQLKLAGDWSVDLNYQAVQAQCVPDFDMQGIGTGNSSKNGFYYTNIDGTLKPSTRSTADGDGNYRGFELTVQYLWTNNLNIFQQWKQSVTLDKDIGPSRRYKQYEIDIVYLF